MYDKLRQIGIPATIATAVTLLVVVAPLLFQIDERYVKADDHEKIVRDLEKKNDDLSRELAKLSGFQEAMVTFIQEGRIPRPGVLSHSPTVVPPSATFTDPPLVGSSPKNWSELKEGLALQQRRLSQ